MYKMDLRAKSSNEVEIYKERLKCDHSEGSLYRIIDTEVVQVDSNTIDEYQIRICPNGHYFRTYIRTHQESSPRGEGSPCGGS